MRKSVTSGKTILFVSHNLASIRHLCSRAVLLQSGQISADGLAHDVIDTYLSGSREETNVPVADWHDRQTNGQARIVHFEILDESGQPTDHVRFGGRLTFSIVAEFHDAIMDPCFGILFHSAAVEPMLDLRSAHAGLRIGRVKGRVVLDACVENINLYPGAYLLSPWITESASCHECLDWAKYCRRLHVDPFPGVHGDLRLDWEYGRYWVPSDWNIRST